jgi:hypothetical protein
MPLCNDRTIKHHPFKAVLDGDLRLSATQLGRVNPVSITLVLDKCAACCQIVRCGR